MLTEEGCDVQKAVFGEIQWRAGNDWLEIRMVG